MPRERQKGLDDKDKERLLSILEESGKLKWFKRWKDHMAIPHNLDVLSKDRNDREKVLRYLLLMFCRAGLLEEVLYEDRRPYIIQASKMRPGIGNVVSNFEKIPFYVDNGAFYLFEDGYCTDLDPNCAECPIGEICKRYIKWTAYKMSKK